MWFTEEKLEGRIAEIRATIHRDSLDIPSFVYLEGDYADIARLGEAPREPGYDDKGWQAFPVGGYWGGYDKSAWFRTRVTIPEAWRERRLALRFLAGPRDGGGSTAEALLYVDGKALQGIDIWHEEALLPPETAARGEIHVALKAWSGVLRVPERRHFKLAKLVAVDEPAERLFHLADTVLKAVRELPPEDYRRAHLLGALNEAMLAVDFIRYRSDAYYESVGRACATLAGRLNETEALDGRKPLVTGIGHAHIDMAWLWRLVHSRDKAARTFATALHLMRQYPEYRFMHTSPQLYKFLKTDYPDIFAEVKERIASGEWEITGGMWVEPDMNVTSGESIVRQLLFGKRFIKREFGVDTNVVFLPDVFGYNWAMPQIMKRSGIDSFITSKISWSQYNRFPHDTFMWRGIDGTEMLTHFITTPEVGSKPFTYNGIIDPYQVKGTWDQYQQKNVVDEVLTTFGWGDGGGGPTKEMLEAARAMKNLPGFPRVEIGKVEPFMERLGRKAAEGVLPVWDGELYLEYHRGTYTSQGFLKRANRKAELLYRRAEWMNVMADLLSGVAGYPQEELNAGWEMLLLNQFHDILPGSSIRQVYEDAREDFREIERIGVGAENRARRTLLDGIAPDGGEGSGRAVVAFNALGWSRSGLLELPLDPDTDAVAAGRGQTVAGDDGKSYVLLQIADLPALGYAVVQPEPTLPSVGKVGMTITPELLENRYYRIRLNGRGQLVSVYDKRASREVLAPGERGNVLQVFEDRPMKFDAWDIDLFYQEKMEEIDALEEAAVEEEGPWRGSLRLRWRFNRSTVTQRITLYAGSPRIDFRTSVDWQEKQVLLKAAFPVDIRSTRATYDIQFGSIERPTHWNTSWDYAKFEVCGHKWADLSEGGYGVALLNDCKYGHDVKGNVLRLTLIKSAVEPDETADRGAHVFTYSLLPHLGDWREGGVVREAYELNEPLAGSVVRADAGIEGSAAGALPGRFSLVEPGSANIVVDTVKKAEDDGSCVVRVYECMGMRGEAALSFGVRVGRAVECNLVEEEEGPAEAEGGVVRFKIKPFEIKTFKIGW